MATIVMAFLTALVGAMGKTRAMVKVRAIMTSTTCDAEGSSSTPAGLEAEAGAAIVMHRNKLSFGISSRGMEILGALY
jgi:hypothetical protein